MEVWKINIKNEAKQKTKNKFKGNPKKENLNK